MTQSKSGLVKATEDAPSGRLSTASSNAPVTSGNEDLREAIDRLLERYYDFTHGSCGVEYRDVQSARSVVEEMFKAPKGEEERLQREIKAMSEMYTQVTSPLQECCQRHKLGLGGEFCHELVVEEVDRLSANTLTAEDALSIVSIANAFPRFKHAILPGVMGKLRAVSERGKRS